MDVKEFADQNNIKWFPLNVKVTKEGKIPSYPKQYKTKPDQNDFKNLDEMAILERHDYLDDCNCIALDTSEIRIIDVDFEDDIDYQKDYPDAYEYVENLIKSGIAYKKSNTKKKGKHFFIKTDYKFNGVRTQTKFKHIELLTGQWAFSPKDRKVRNDTIGFYDLKDIVQQQAQQSQKKKLIIKKKHNNNKMNPSDNIDPKIQKYADLIDIEYLDAYDSWTKIIWSLSNDLDNNNYEIAKYISAKSEKYNEAVFNKLWSNSREGSSMGTFYYYCKLSDKDGYFKLRSLEITEHFFTEDNLAQIYYNENFENLVYKDDMLYIFHNKLWYEDRKLNKLKYYISKYLTEYLGELGVQLYKKVIECNSDENLKFLAGGYYEKLEQLNKCIASVQTATKKKKLPNVFFIIYQLGILII